MSYCRWSCADFQCDLYVYEGDGGFCIHIGQYRVRPKEPLPPHIELTTETVREWHARHKEVLRLIENGEREKIELPGAGTSYSVETLGDLLEEMLRLRALGYRFPDYVIDDIRSEIADQ